MTDREKLIELLDEGLDRINRGTLDFMLEILADHLLAHGVTFAIDNNVGGKWISVTERLPEPFETVLVYDSTGKRIEAAYMTRHKEWLGVMIKNEITHWMPLPEPPKEGE